MSMKREERRGGEWREDNKEQVNMRSEELKGWKGVLISGLLKACLEGYNDA